MLENIIMMKHNVVALLFAASLTALIGCGASGIRPVDIYPEDICSHCRMAISDEAFAAEIISEQQEVFKFDDIGCLEKFQTKRTDVVVAAVFYKDHTTKQWVPSDRAAIVATGVFTPMGSGKVAFADKAQAEQFARENPPSKSTDGKQGKGGCKPGCCTGKGE
jgi:copper chaperone NosL